MKKERLYLLTIMGISAIVLLISFIAFQYAYRSTENKLLQTQLQSGQREVREIAKLLEQQLESGLSKQQVIHHLQQSILNTDVQNEFICMYNTKGIELCHPNPALVGQVIDAQNSIVQELGNDQSISFNQILKTGQHKKGIRSFADKKRNSEIINIYPVAGTDWMVASHANLTAIRAQLSDLFLQFLAIYLMSSLLIVGGCFMLIRFLYRKYEKNLEAEKEALNKEVIELNTLNKQLNASQERLQKHFIEQIPAVPLKENKEVVKKRLVTYYKDELIKLEIEEIAFFYLQNGITYFHTFDRKNYNTSNSLDDIMKQLDALHFYRANRQFIVNIKAIESILLYGKNQLKLITSPHSDAEIIISKNKVAEFKLWLDQ